MNFIKQYLYNHGIDEDRMIGIATLKGRFFEINWIKTIWFNIKALPLRQAIRTPIIISFNTKIRSVGNIKINGKVTPGMISIGVIKIDPWESNADQIIFCNNGLIEFGGRTKIHPGTKINVQPSATLKLGERAVIGCKTKIICFKSITFGDNVRCSWECQVFDTDFHFMKNINNGKIYQRLRPITIGNNVLIGNRSTIGKGTIIPSNCIVSCCSKVAKDFTVEGENLLIVGNPASAVGKGYQMISSGWDEKSEKLIAKSIGE